MSKNRKIAAPITADHQIDDHFGHCEYYGVYSVTENNEISDVSIIPSPQGCGCKSNIAGVLADQGVTLMLAGGIGDGAVNVLNHWGIDVVRGCNGDARDAVKAFLNGSLTDSGQNCLHHHQDGDGHQCNN
ncbi:MAG TPA: NifB/NifX family molybdenum-iron cluster-binding protein [Bacteroidales bacterium]|nr:NifB/NifX family molybdenum-iron cluster-binding protein [Bacteroidales bacterium]HPT01054.1 NifB/NifX family molybdenum-iron cluster-binding protein [Bacteroidales bacterium]